MKIRNGFVSNSSSSSFIVAIKKEPNKCEHCGRSDPNILDAIRQKGNCWGEETEIEAVGTDNVLEFVEEIGEYNGGEYTREIKANINPYDNEDWELAAFYISYRDEVLKEMIENAKISGSIVILHEDG